MCAGSAGHGTGRAEWAVRSEAVLSEWPGRSGAVRAERSVRSEAELAWLVVALVPAVLAALSLVLLAAASVPAAVAVLSLAVFERARASWQACLAVRPLGAGASLGAGSASRRAAGATAWAASSEDAAKQAASGHSSPT